MLYEYSLHLSIKLGSILLTNCNDCFNFGIYRISIIIASFLIKLYKSLENVDFEYEMDIVREFEVSEALVKKKGVSGGGVRSHPQTVIVVSEAAGGPQLALLIIIILVLFNNIRSTASHSRNS
jgi:hypothetical protein